MKTVQNRICIFAGLVILASAAMGQQLSWVGNTRLYATGAGQIPSKGGFVNSYQSVSITTQTYPVSSGQSVYVIYTTNNWISTTEVLCNFDYNVGNNSQWYAVLGPLTKGSDVQFYVRAQTATTTVYDNNGWQNFGYISRYHPQSRRGAILQWFATDYKTILARLPEVILAGYSAIYLPGPQKSGGGSFSAGYNPFDRFDLGDRLQQGTVRTRFGTTQELIELIQTAKRLGLEVYCDLVTGHNDNRASSAINRYPDMIPEDFHIKSSADTSNSEMDLGNAPPFGFGTLNHDIVGLADIAHEDGNQTQTGAFNLPSFATFNSSNKPSFVRHPQVAQYYAAGVPYAEDVRELLKRWGWFLVERIGFDGFRVDAVRHQTPGFFHRLGTQAGYAVSRGDLIPYLYSLDPDLNIFGEDYAGDNYELREYAKTGMNLLDFPLKFALDGLFNSSGFGNISQALSNPFGIDSNTALAFEHGGLWSEIGTTFVQSHDQGPPYSNNIAHAWTLTRPGSTIVYYDGNNLTPNDYSQFPKPGRSDALGAFWDGLTRLTNARARFGRGYIVNRVTQDHLYVFERQVDGNSILLVGLNNRGDTTSITATVDTQFLPNTTLVDLSGQRPNVVVGSDRKVTLTVPPNTDAQSANNARGYVVYVPKFPTQNEGQNAITLVNSEVPQLVIENQSYDLPHGPHAPPSSFVAATITCSKVDLRVRTTQDGETACAKFDNGIALPGYHPQSGTPEGLADGFIPMTKIANGDFALNGISVSNLSDGLHVIRVRVFANYPGMPGVFNDFIQFIYLHRRSTADNPNYAIDGQLTDLGTPISTQSRNPSSNLNRVDALYARNDDRFLYLGVAGRVDASENLTNGICLFLDLDPGASTGVRDFSTLADDSGPAARLLSNARFTAPATFGAEVAAASFRNGTLHSAPETPFVGDPVPPPLVGAQAGVFRINLSQLNWLQGISSVVACKPRINKSDPPSGLEFAIPLRQLYSGTVATNQAIGIITYLCSTGETGTTLLSTDPLRGTIGGRPAAVSWLSNQILPFQTNNVNDIGTSPYTAQFSQNFTLQRSALAPGQLILKAGSVKSLGNRRFSQLLSITNRSASQFSSRIALLVRFPGLPDAVLIGKRETSLLDPSASYIMITQKGMAPSETVKIELEYEVQSGTPSPTFELRVGEGLT